MKSLTRAAVIGTILTAIISFSILSCSKKSAESLKMATTTSTDNTGLLDYMEPEFKADTGIELKWVAVGTGRALKLGRNCDVDILMVHAPGAEKKFVKDGHGVNRTEVMFNDFVIIGPKNDPSGIKGKTVKEAFKIISVKKAKFASRGDNSGTNKKEISLWKSSGLKVPDKQSWYVQTGQGMINTINIAAERKACTMTDRGTYIKYESSNKGKPPLVILVQGDAVLKNQYSVIEINKTKCTKAKNNLAKKFTKWIVSPKAQKLIGDFKLLGKQLFKPNAKK